MAAMMKAAAAPAAAVADDDESGAADFIDIMELQSLGLGAADLSKVRAAGLVSVELLLSTPKKDLLNIKGISDTKVEKLLEAARKMKPTGFVTGGELLATNTKNRIRVTTGCKDLDAILGGGVETGVVTELFGEFRSGKTQLCAQLAVTAQLPRESGGGAGKVIILDTENAFRMERVAQIASLRYGLDRDAVLENLLYAAVLNSDHQQEMLALAAAKIAEDECPYRLLIVDSIIAHFRVEYSGRGELAERQQKLAVFMRELVKFAQCFNVAVVVCNQVTADPGNMFVADAKKPVGGNIVAHYCDTRVYLRKGKGNQRIARIHAGPLPEAEATFALSDTGITDAE